MEYLFVVGFAFLLTIPLIMVFYSQSASLEDEVIAAQAKKVVNELVSTIDTMYYLGPPSKQTIRLHFPKKIESITIQDSAVTFRIGSSIGGAYELTGYAATNITGTLEIFNGVHVITAVALTDSVNLTDN